MGDGKGRGLGIEWQGKAGTEWQLQLRGEGGACASLGGESSEVKSLWALPQFAAAGGGHAGP